MNEMSNKAGVCRAIYLPKSLDEQIEKVKDRLGWSRSYLYKYALTRFLQELRVLSENVKEVEK